MSDDPSSSPCDIDVLVEASAWTAALPEAEAVVRRAAGAALAALGPLESDVGETGPLSVCLLLADDATLQRLNREFRAKDRPTNVLSFPGEAPMLGDIALAQETCAREAAAQGKALAAHLSHLVVHGVLHLCGYDHETDAEAEEMEALEVEILAGLGIADPYEEAAAAAAAER
mgnify:CR=1 FL=1